MASHRTSAVSRPTAADRPTATRRSTARRGRTGRRSAVAVAATTALIVLVGCDNLSYRRLDFDTTESAPITAIQVLPGAGDVVVRAEGGVDGARVKRVVRYQGAQPDATYEIRGAELVLDASCGPRCSVSYEVTVGEGVSVRGETGSGNVDLSRVGQVDLKVGSGDVRVAAATDAVRVETGSGNVEVYDVSAPVVMRASSGNVTASRLGGSVDAEAKSGNVTLELDKPASVRAHASSGNVELAVPKGGYQVRSRVGSGRTDLGVTHDPSAASVLDLRTGSGNITVTVR
ncbi:DUF4097 family beta strand repeat-containing protein [Verrucosispora sp. WMMA2044]|uniref:DUF4097 family beta strand repeat-containing protein n=1 Tax=Verrucosispora sp. WMMA2044 TaxID=3016419 RepID=UPI00248AF574|nr:DUF4097 family beta strand repeat-containing protein [Verrucosispora sp. WMMA2044]WBB49590.1 DUF4097 family beta strand repeat-containing protein [Verrucosispora sp. WMMA2044]